jgi:hypothetical protein
VSWPTRFFTSDGLSPSCARQVLSCSAWRHVEDRQVGSDDRHQLQPGQPFKQPPGQPHALAHRAQHVVILQRPDGLVFVQMIAEHIDAGDPIGPPECQTPLPTNAQAPGGIAKARTPFRKSGVVRSTLFMIMDMSKPPAWGETLVRTRQFLPR